MWELRVLIAWVWATSVFVPRQAFCLLDFHFSYEKKSYPTSIEAAKITAADS